MSNRFVILHHRIGDGEHWDLMLEQGDVLLTWQLLKEPAGPGSFPIPAHRIGEHRKAYLDYEGPVSGSRGFVTRIDRGELTIVHASPDYYELELAGDRLKGKYCLRFSGDGWEFTTV